MQDVLNGIEKRNSVCSEYFNEELVFVDVSIIMDISNGGCQLISCPGRSKVKNSKTAKEVFLNCHGNVQKATLDVGQPQKYFPAKMSRLFMLIQC